MSKKALIVFNPMAGKGQIKNKLWRIIDLFVKDGYQIGVHSTQSLGDTEAVTEKYGSKCHILVVIGGDGTLNEAIRGLMKIKNKPLLGYIPSGTVNDFASTLKLSKDIVKAAGNILKGSPFEFDIGKLNDAYFTYVSAFGAFTDVSYQTTQQAKNTLGHIAYIFEGLRRLNNIKPYHMRISFDGTAFEDDFVLGMISNSKYIAGFENVNTNVSLNDGLFEITLIKNPKNAIELQTIISAYVRRQPDNYYINTFSTSSAVFESDEEIPWTLDGEFGGCHKKAQINILPSAITILK